MFVGLAAKEDGSGKAFYLAGVLHTHGVAFGQAVGQCFVVFSRRFAAAMELIRCAVFNQPVLQFFKAALTVFKTSFKKKCRLKSDSNLLFSWIRLYLSTWGFALLIRACVALDSVQIQVDKTPALQSLVESWRFGRTCEVAGGGRGHDVQPVSILPLKRSRLGGLRFMGLCPKPRTRRVAGFGGKAPPTPAGSVFFRWGGGQGVSIKKCKTKSAFYTF